MIYCYQIKTFGRNEKRAFNFIKLKKWQPSKLFLSGPRTLLRIRTHFIYALELIHIETSVSFFF